MPVDLNPSPDYPAPPDGAKPVPDACPACGLTHVLHIVEKLHAKPLGTFSLSGNQIKHSATPVIVLECRACEASVTGKVEPGGTHAVFDPREMRRGDHDSQG